MVSWGLWQPSPAGTQITMGVWGVLAFIFFLQASCLRTSPQAEAAPAAWHVKWSTTRAGDCWRPVCRVRLPARACPTTPALRLS